MRDKPNNEEIITNTWQRARTTLNSFFSVYLWFPFLFLVIFLKTIILVYCLFLSWFSYSQEDANWADHETTRGDTKRLAHSNLYIDSILQYGRESPCVLAFPSISAAFLDLEPCVHALNTGWQTALAIFDLGLWAKKPTMEAWNSKLCFSEWWLPT